MGLAIDNSIKQAMGRSGLNFKQIRRRSDDYILWKRGITVTYITSSGIYQEEFEPGSDVLNHALIVGIITIIVYNVIGCTWFAKRDIA